MNDRRDPARIPVPPIRPHGFHNVHELRPFQRRFLRRAFAPGVRLAALSLARGNGKSTLAGRLLADFMRSAPGGPDRGKEAILLAGSVEQARIVFRALRDDLGETAGFKWTDSANRIGARHKDSNTRVRVISSNAKAAFGLVGNPIVVGDEPGTWEVRGGELMYDALATSLGKPDNGMRVILIGTVAPAVRGWWPDLIAKGTHGSRHVTALQGDPERWDCWPEIRRCNPLMSTFPESRAVLLEERDEARRDPRLKARFLSFRLNRPTADESTTLLTAEDWKRVRARPVPEREGQPIVGIDLGGGRAWSAAVALWPNGRCEAVAVAPGIPSIEAQEKRDRVPKGAYARLVASGALRPSSGLRVPPPRMLIDVIRERWGVPRAIVCDRFRINELRDTGAPCPIAPRVTRYSESSFDIRALQKAARDGALACPPDSVALILESIIAAEVRSDDAGNVRLRKRDPGGNSGRDDVAAALVLAAGAAARAPAPRSGPVIRVVHRAA